MLFTVGCDNVLSFQPFIPVSLLLRGRIQISSKVVCNAGNKEEGSDDEYLPTSERRPGGNGRSKHQAAAADALADGAGHADAKMADAAPETAAGILPDANGDAAADGGSTQEVAGTSGADADVDMDAEEALGDDGSPNKRRGRPKGTKNVPTIRSVQEAKRLMGKDFKGHIGGYM